MPLHLKEACGVPTKSFDAAVAYVEGRGTNKGSSVYERRGCQATKGIAKVKTKSSRLWFTLGFLDTFFKCKYFILCYYILISLTALTSMI